MTLGNVSIKLSDNQPDAPSAVEPLTRKPVPFASVKVGQLFYLKHTNGIGFKKVTPTLGIYDLGSGPNDPARLAFNTSSDSNLEVFVHTDQTV